MRNFTGESESGLVWTKLRIPRPPPPKAALKMMGKGRFSPRCGLKDVESTSAESRRVWTCLDASGIPWRSKNSLAALHEARNGDPFKTSEHDKQCFTDLDCFLHCFIFFYCFHPNSFCRYFPLRGDSDFAQVRRRQTTLQAPDRHIAGHRQLTSLDLGATRCAAQPMHNHRLRFVRFVAPSE